MDGYLLDLTHLDSVQKWAIICAAVLTVVYAVMRPWRKRKDPLARPPVSLSAQREVEKQMTELLVELEQMARQMTAQLETRSAKLELLIKEADERIASLQAGPVGAAAGSPVASLTLPPDPLHAEVCELFSQGHSARQIAQRLGRPYGEVELVLALRGQHEDGDVTARTA